MRERLRVRHAFSPSLLGHDLEDLTLTSLRWDRGDDGTIRIELFVES